MFRISQSNLIKNVILGVFLIGTFLVSPTVINAQNFSADKYGKGLNIIAKDSSYSLKFGIRIQSLYSGIQNTNTKEYTDNFMVRRQRLKFDGFIHNPKVEYKLELGQSTRDATLGNGINSNSSGTILDALIKYNFYRNWSLWVGQTKMPGNIERVISSQSLQFVDRCNVNARFTLDRDQGIQLRREGEFTRFAFALSKGEGRNDINANSGGYEYTYRFEYLPFGQFDDYKASDLKRYQTPKLMLGITYDYNDNAIRQRGNLGSYMADNRTLQTWFIDGHFKYNGFSSMFTYASKTAGNHFVGPGGHNTNETVIKDQANQIINSFYTGSGLNWQAGYLFPSNFEVAARYTQVIVEEETNRNNNYQYTLGVSRYIVGHTFKVQSDISLIKEDNRDNNLMFRIQVEFGI